MTLPLDLARALVRDRLGLDFPSRREEDLARALRDTPPALADEPLTSGGWRTLIAALTVQESYFFRDHALFDALAERVLPALVAERRAAGELRLTFWSAGCSEGQEPYSLAMVLDRLLPDLAAWEVTILGTDINEDALEAARAGVYSDWALRDLPVWARRHFSADADKRHTLAAAIRKMVTFAPLNLAMDPFPGSLDLIVCRNVLMYMTDDVRAEAVRRLGAALAPTGRLALSPLDSSPELEEPLLEPDDAGGVRLLARSDDVPAPEPEPAPAPKPVAEATPPLPPALERARAAADQGRSDAALTLCLQALRDDPLDAEAHLLMAAVEEERGDLAAAIAAVRRAIYTAPESPTAHFRLGTLLLRRGDEIAARRSLATAAELFGEAAPAPLLARVGS